MFFSQLYFGGKLLCGRPQTRRTQKSKGPTINDITNISTKGELSNSYTRLSQSLRFSQIFTSLFLLIFYDIYVHQNQIVYNKQV